ncbi:MAG: cyclic nucleotide-binding domain-containing protein, partial [Deltaproteobacteria bacterium]|nr:cyclic nucleotide-binding domain-containing protein [Deltaproteobacteria bacterium]
DRLREMVLATSPLLRDLPLAIADRLLGACKAVTARRGQVVMSTSQGVPAFHLVLLGALEVLGPKGEVLGELSAGDAFGHAGALRRDVSPHDVRSLGFAQMLRMDSMSLMQITAEEALLAERFDWAISEWVNRFGRS